MPTITTLVVVVGALFPVVVIGLYGVTRVLPRDRDIEFEFKLFPPTLRFSVTRNTGRRSGG
jgi:hypothetical protein